MGGGHSPTGRLERHAQPFKVFKSDSNTYRGSKGNLKRRTIFRGLGSWVFYTGGVR
jgi:hypothetical protein